MTGMPTTEPMNGTPLSLVIPQLPAHGDTQPLRPLTWRQRRSVRRERREQAGWTKGRRLLAWFQVVLGFGIAALAFYLIYRATVDLLRPHMDAAWIVPVCGEIAFTYLFAQSILMALRRAPAGVVRSAFMAVLMAGSIALQALAAHHNLPSLIGHEVVVTAFFGVLLSGKSTVLSLLGGKVRPDRIGTGEWIAHPVHSARLWRWRQGWGQCTLAQARQRYMVLLYIRDIAQADERVGRERRWQAKLPVTLRYQLSTGLLPGHIAAGEGDWQEAATEHVRGQLELLPPVQPEGAPDDSDEGNGGGSSEDARDDTSGGSDKGSGGGNPDDTSDGSEWPETKDIQKAVLMRRVKAADARWTKQHGKPIPALQLSSQLKVRMSRDTATTLLQQARGRS